MRQPSRAALIAEIERLEDWLSVIATDCRGMAPGLAMQALHSNAPASRRRRRKQIVLCLPRFSPIS